MIMSKYDQFIEDLNKEVDNMNISNVSTYVKAKHKETKKTKPVFFRSKLVPISCFSIVLVIVLVLTVLNIGNNTEGPIKNKVKVPTIATSIEEAYAFEIMAAGNLLYSSSTQTNTRIKKRSLSRNNVNLNDVATKINEHYLTIKQMLSKEKVKYEILQNDDGTYENKMIIQAFFNSELDLQYTIYFNKTKVLKHEDNEELFNIEGIITIDNKTYQVFGEIESEEDEIETKIKVVTGENEYFVIEQEKEVDEEEFVYTSYINNKKQNEYTHEYKYTIVSNGKKVNEVELELEQENGELSVELKEVSNNTKTSYKFKVKEEKGYKYIKVEVKEGNNVTNIKVRLILNTETNTYTYEYKYI